jgi:NAD(P)-dependent dehydrogenase (short-subunit alcohol dehydrogenase family)
MGRLDGKVAIVTGSSAGIGRASAEAFAREGAAVVVSASGRRPELGESVAKGIVERGGRAVYQQCNVLDRGEIKALVRRAKDEFGRIDILMNNAVAGKNAKITEQREEDWDAVVASSITASFVAIKESLPVMIEGGGGSIINVSSVHGMLAGMNNVAYATVKAGLINMSRQVAVQYGPEGIRCNALCPGRIVTEAKVDFLEANPVEYRRQKSVYPLGRPGTMEECAAAALFLASDESSFVTGVALPVDGGLTAQLQDAVAGRIEAGVTDELAGRGVTWP